jgi:hypothetical protein
MSNLLYIVAVILIIIWAINVFFYAVGGLIHIIIVMAIAAFLLGVIRRA